jgi:hypothetical protein
MALRTLCGIAQNSENDAARVAACAHILDRGWGKPTQARTAENGEGAIKVVVRHIVGGRDVALDAKVIDATPVRHEGGDEG